MMRQKLLLFSNYPNSAFQTDDRYLSGFSHEGRKASHNNFSSEPPGNPRPSIICVKKFPILEDKTIFLNLATLGHKIWME